MPDTPPPSPTAAPGSNVENGSRRKPRRTRRRWWLLLLLTAAASLALSPEAWHGALRSFLTWRAARQNWDLQIGAIDGGLFDSTQLYAVHCTQRGVEAKAGQPLPASGTDFQIERLELAFAWRWPWSRQPARAWLGRMTIEGLHGTCDLKPARIPARPPAGRQLTDDSWRQQAVAAALRLRWRAMQMLRRQLGRLDNKLVPADLDVRGSGFTLERGRYHLRLAAVRLTVWQDETGWFAAQQVEASGPQFHSVLATLSGWTFRQGSRLTLGDVDLGRGVHLAQATLNGQHLDRQRLDWDGELTALGGSARGQGAISFARPRLNLEIAGSLATMAVRPLARLLGVAAETDGEVEQANFTFRGDPENWPAAEMWLAAHATDFRWGQRRWESLELRGVIINRRVQVHRLELRQNRNQLSFTGECAVPAAAEDAASFPALTATAWWHAGFSCNIDARVDDLHALAQLAGDGMPELAGRMSVNGTLSARPGTPGIDGYLNVEGSALTIRGAPLDYLRSTLLFKAAELDVADLQATRGSDYLRGQGSWQIMGPARYKAEVHAAIKDLAVYAPAYADLPSSPQPLEGSLTLDWSGDGAPGANSGAFQGSMAHFFTKGGPAALAQPIDLSADGTYSPESVSFRHLVLQEGVGDKRHDVLKLEGALPWTRDPQAFAAGRWLDPERPMSVRLQFAETPLDVLAGLAPGLLASAAGQISGWLNADGTLRAPRLEADLQLSDASFHPANGAPVLADVSARMRLEKSVLQIEQAKGQWGTNSLNASGTLDLADTAKIGLNLTIQGSDAAGLHNEMLDAGLNFALTLRGSPGAGALIGGEINLTAGRYERALTTGYDDLAVADWLDLSRRLPSGWGPAQIDLELTATPALRIAGGSAEAALRPELRFTGTVEAPRVTGTLTAHGARWSDPGGWQGIGDGTWYLAGGQTEGASLSVRAHDANGAEVFWYGGAAAGQWVAYPEAQPPQWDEPSAMAAFVSGL